MSAPKRPNKAKATAKTKPLRKVVQMPPPKVKVEAGDAQDLSILCDLGPPSWDEAVDALRYIDPERDYKEWFSVLGVMATEFGKTPEVETLLLDHWSKGELFIKSNKVPANFNTAKNQKAWATVQPGHSKFGTIHNLAVAGGWDPKPWRRARVERSGGVLIGGDTCGLAAKVWEALKRQEEDPLFRSGNQITRINHSIESLTKDALWQYVGDYVKFFRLVGKGTTVPCDPPLPLITWMLNTPPQKKPLPELLGMTETPVLAPDGTIQSLAGYSPVTKLYHRPAVEVDRMPDHPNEVEVKAARKLLEEVVCDFPFVDQSDRAHALAMMLTPFVRSVITGNTPIYLINKPTSGTGATLLGEIATLIKTGRALSATNAPRDEDEWRKTILAKLLTLPEFFFVDNVTVLRSEALATVMTADEYEARLLGSSEMAKVPVKCTWIMTGNNPELSADFPRRVVHIRQDANLERPDEDRKFTHADLKGWVLSERGRLIAAILTLCRAWVVAGRPKPTGTMASFESWAEVIGGILQFAGIAGFLETPDERRHDAGDGEQERAREFVTAWLYYLIEEHTTPPANKVPPEYQKAKARTLLKMATVNQLAIAESMRWEQRASQTQFGHVLRRIKDQTFVVSANDRTDTEPTPLVTVKVLLHGGPSETRWELKVMGIRIQNPDKTTKAAHDYKATDKAPDWAGLGITKTMFWTPLPM